MAEFVLGILLLIVVGTPIVAIGVFLLVIAPSRYRSGKIGPILLVKGLFLGLVAVALGLALIVGGGFGAVRRFNQLQQRPVSQVPEGAKSQLELNRGHEQSRDSRFEELRQRSQERTSDIARPRFQNPGDAFPRDDPFDRDETFRLYPASEVMAEEGPLAELERAKAAAKARQPKFNKGVPSQLNRPGADRDRFQRPLVPVEPPKPPAPPTVIVGSEFRSTPSTAAPASENIDPATEVWLRDLQPTTSEVLTRDEHHLLRDIVLGGVGYSHSLYTHPPENRQPARVIFKLDGRYRRLRGSAGQIDGFPPTSASPLTFKILGDGKELWSSREISRHGESEAFDIDVADVTLLELRTECPGLHSFAWGAWVDPVLRKK